MKTAVEFLANVWAVQGKLYTEDIEQAKEMEKEQMINFAKDCMHKDDCFFIVEQYYNETFKSE